MRKMGWIITNELNLTSGKATPKANSIWWSATLPMLLFAPNSFPTLTTFTPLPLTLSIFPAFLLLRGHLMSRKVKTVLSAAPS